MNSPKYLPDNKENKLYTPKKILEMIVSQKAQTASLEAFYSNPKNNKIIEMEYASAFAIAMYSSTGDKYLIYPAENPDIHFIKQESIDKRQIGFSVEIMTLFDFKTRSFDQNYNKLAGLVWQKKGNADYDRTELLLISRLNCMFDIDKFIEEMKKYSWKFLRIWLGVYKPENEWDFFEIIPPQNEKSVKITADFKKAF